MKSNSRQALMMFVVALAAIVASSSSAEAAICKVKVDSIGTVIGKGRTQSQAFEDAATQCFDKLMSGGRSAASIRDNEEKGLAVIDQCANVKCEG